MSNSQIATIEPAQAVQQQTTQMSMVQWAIENKATPEQLVTLYELQQRVEADAARRLFNQAFSDFKAESVSVVKNVTVSDGPLKGKKYADLFGVVSAVMPALGRHKLSHSWKITKDEPNWIEVTCTIRHDSGHAESVSMGSEPDKGPGRNAIQARASAVSYLERYTFLAATGHAASTDDDGRNTGKANLSDEDISSFIDNIKSARTEEELRKFYMPAAKAADEAGNREALRLFDEAKKAAWGRIKKGAQA